MTKTTTSKAPRMPKAPRMTKAQKLAKIELETLAIEAQIAAEKAALDAIQDTPVFEAKLEELKAAGDDVDPLYVPIAKPMKQVKTIKTGVGAQILQLIADGVLSNKEIVAKVLEDNPLRKTTYACVAWYKSQVAAGKIDLPAAQEEVMEECATGMEDETLSEDQA